MKFVTDMWSVCGVSYRLYPGGVECEITYMDETGYSTATGWVPAPEGQIESYDRHELAGNALERAVDIMNGQLSALNDEIERRHRDRCTEENPCCDRRNEYNGFASGPLSFVCPKNCSCHD